MIHVDVLAIVMRRAAPPTVRVVRGPASTAAGLHRGALLKAGRSIGQSR